MSIDRYIDILFAVFLTVFTVMAIVGAFVVCVRVFA